MRLIDADATIIGLDTALACSRVVAGKDAIQNKALDIFENARDFVANMPTIDAVPVVRCRECKRGQVDDPEYDPDLYFCELGCGLNKGHFFCSYGERREGDG